MIRILVDKYKKIKEKRRVRQEELLNKKVEKSFANYRESLEVLSASLKSHNFAEEEYKKYYKKYSETIRYEEMDFATRDYGRQHIKKILKDLRLKRGEIAVEICALKDLFERINEIDGIKEEIVDEENTLIG